jgi:hypothetical protein
MNYCNFSLSNDSIIFDKDINKNYCFTTKFFIFVKYKETQNRYSINEQKISGKDNIICKLTKQVLYTQIIYGNTKGLKLKSNLIYDF